MPESISDRKRALRQKLRAAAREAAAHPAAPQRRAREAQALARALAADLAFARAPEVAAFVSLPDEIDTGPVRARVHAAGKQLLLPRIDEDRLVFVEAPIGATLVPGRFGVSVPAATWPSRPPRNGAWLLIPGLGFDVRGVRLGRGAGYYDRALAELAAAGTEVRRIGVARAAQRVEALPTEPHDVPMDALLTEDGLVWICASGPATSQDPDSTGKGMPE